MKKGFTLVETMVTVAIFTLAIGIAIGMIIAAYRTYGETWRRFSVVNEARGALETMIQEIRKADTGEDGSYPVGEAEDGELTIYSDIDKDGSIEKVRYFWQEGETANFLKKGVTESFVDDQGITSYPSGQEEITVLNYFVCNEPPIFRYFDDNNQEIAEADDRVLGARMIQVYLVVNTDKEKTSQNFELLSSAQIRNLKEE